MEEDLSLYDLVFTAVFAVWHFLNNLATAMICWEIYYSLEMLASEERT